MALDIKQLIQDKSGDRDYFAMVPGLLWPDIKLCSGSSIVEPLPVHIQEIGIELNVHDKWLYASLKKICGETDGQCFLSTRGLAKFAGMSTGQTSKSKAKLEEVGLIEIVCKKRSVRGQAIDHITVVDIWEENIKVMKARKEGVHLVNALREKQERSQKGAKRSSDEAKCSPCETEEEPIEEEPKDEEEKEEEPSLFPEKPKTLAQPQLDARTIKLRLTREKGKPRVVVPDEVDRAAIEAIIEQEQDNPTPWDLARRTAAAQDAVGNYADTAQAGGDDAAATAAMVAMYSALKSEPPGEGSDDWKNQIEIFSQALRDRGVQDVAIAEKAGKLMGAANLETPHFANPRLASFPAAFGILVGRAKKQGDDKTDCRARDVETMEASLFAFEERMAASSLPEEGPDQIPWNLTLDTLGAQVGQATFYAYYRDTRLLSLDDGTAVVQARDGPVRDWLQNRAEPIGRELSQVLGRAVEVRFEEGS